MLCSMSITKVIANKVEILSALQCYSYLGMSDLYCFEVGIWNGELESPIPDRLDNTSPDSSVTAFVDVQLWRKALFRTICAYQEPGT